ncbi:response regulator receiver-modulated diguanylate cyclase [Arcobacter acticola]|jgi:two-component system cell cycle response regulator|uniref:diguanylate cyclase n=1 Tax=Arcobacter acticola TaxID=1849015 RepID=A0A6M8EF73_9BACT|nr:diguanylate cyclase [Arcobacter acticola]QKE28632.1 response regulator receiver-modulated diguanylate cyclase [Arcobacter acticola]
MNKEILKNISILYVEDESDVREFTSKLLSSLLKNVFTAENGQDGLDLYKENINTIDLIVTDINMPKMNGIAMCEKIRELNKEIPIVVTSAHNDTDFLKKAIDVGVSTYAMKPIDLYQLIESITKAIEPIFLKKELVTLNLSLESKIEMEIEKINSILDAQENIVIVTNKEEITNINKKFLEFFGIESFEKFKEAKKDIFDLFHEEFGFITRNQMEKQECWLKYIKELPEIDRIVKIKNHKNEERLFTINIDYYENKEHYYIFSLTDITSIKEKANLLEYQSSHDKITGLFNKNKFDEFYEKEVKRSKRYKNDLSIILFDIYEFREIIEINKSSIGDIILKEISQIMSNCIREQDISARWGGEEFLILLPQTNLEGAQIVANKINNTVFEHLFTEKQLKLSANFGVSELKEEDDEKTFMSRVNKLLFESKNRGKSVVIAR